MSVTGAKFAEFGERTGLDLLEWLPTGGGASPTALAILGIMPSVAHQCIGAVLGILQRRFNAFRALQHVMDFSSNYFDQVSDLGHGRTRPVLKDT